MRCILIEACPDDSAGSIGPFYVAHHARLAGHSVDISRKNKKGYDVELISVHHCDDLPILSGMPKYAPIRIVGGHMMQNNPRPAIPYADIICVGEGESWIRRVLGLLDEGASVESLIDIPGTIVSSLWSKDNKVPHANTETPLPLNPPYLNRPGTRSAAWYVEIARGCPFSCNYCELGHSAPHRIYRFDHIKKVLDLCDLSKTRKINFYAPDEASHPDWNKMFDHLFELGFMAGFSSMRMDQIIRKRPKVRKNQLVRVGVDGMSERIRAMVGKKSITNELMVEYFRRFLDSGHVQYKMFQIFAYPFETENDWYDFERTMMRIFMLPMKKNVSLRIKWTPFIPQPSTPMRDIKPSYKYDMLDRINVWHALNKRPRTEPGFFVENDGIMSPRSHKRQIGLTLGDENVVKSMGLEKRPPLHEIQ